MRFLLRPLILLLTAGLVLSAQTVYMNNGLTVEGPINYCGTDTGSANAYVCANPTGATIKAYRTGVLYSFKSSHANTGSATLAIDGFAATTIKEQQGAANLASGDIANGGIVVVRYDGTNFQIQSPLGNASGVGSSNPPIFTGFEQQINGGTTLYFSPSGPANNPSGGPGGRTMPVPHAYTISSLYLNTFIGSQPSDGGLSLTLTVNGVPSALTVTIPANTTSPFTVSDTTHTVPVVAGDLLELKIVNASASSSIWLAGCSFILQ